MAFHFKWSIAL